MATRSQSPWTSEEVQLLRDMCIARKSIKEIATSLGRSVKSVEAKKQKKIRDGWMDPIERRPRVWCDAADAIMRENYPAGMPYDRMSDLLYQQSGRRFSISSIKDRAYRLGLSRPDWFNAAAKRRGGRPKASIAAVEDDGPIYIEPERVKVVPVGSFPVKRFSMLGGTIRR